MQHPELNQVFDIEAHTDDVDDLDICPHRKLVMSNSLLIKYLKIYFSKDRINGFVIIKLALGNFLTVFFYFVILLYTGKIKFFCVRKLIALFQK